MKSTGLSLVGDKELIANLKQFGINAEREVIAAVQATAQGLRGNAIRYIQRSPASGIVYQKSEPNRVHRASAPGQAPATDTERLAGSIKAEISGKAATVTADTEYAAFLEFGTQHMEPRPYMTPAMEEERPRFNKRLNEIAERAAAGLTQL